MDVPLVNDEVVVQCVVPVDEVADQAEEETER